MPPPTATVEVASIAGASQGPSLRADAQKIASLATPIVMSMMLGWASGFASVYMLSRLGAETLAGLGMANQISATMVILVFGITTGTMALVARARGARDMKTASHILRQSLLLALLQSVVIGAVGFALAPWLLHALGAEGAAAQAGTLYLRILIFNLAFNAVDFTLTSALRGVGDSMTPLRINIVIVILNISLSALLIFGPGPFPALGIAGSAAGSIIARAVSVAWGWTLLRGGRTGFQWHPGSWSPDRKMIRRIMKIGVPSAAEVFVRTGNSIALMGAVARTGAGTAAVAAYTVGLQLDMFSRMPSMGIGTATTSLVGQRMGTGDSASAERMGWVAAGMGMVLLGVMGILMFVLAGPLAAAFSNDPATARATQDYLRTMALAQPMCALSTVIAGALRGGGDTRFPMWAAFVGGWLFLIPAVFVVGVHLGWGPRAIWMFLALYHTVFAALLAWRFRAGRWKTMRV